jgi:hypothetical protein
MVFFESAMAQEFIKGRKVHLKKIARVSPCFYVRKILKQP